MTFYSRVGLFTQPGSTGNHSVTGVGFQPTALILYGNSNYNESTWGANFSQSIALVTANGSAAIGGSSSNNVATAVTDRRHTQGAYTVEFSSNNYADATLVSFDADGFTLNWSLANAGGQHVGYFAIGGTDITGAKVVEHTQKTTTGTKAVTGVGFQPGLVITIGDGSIVAPPHTETYYAANIGAMDSAGNQWASYYQSNPGEKPSETARAQLTDHTVVNCNTNAAFVIKAAFQSMDADGFTLNWDQVDGTARIYYSLCLKGGAYQVGNWAAGGFTDTINTSTMTPKGVFTVNDSHVGSGAAALGLRQSIGASDGTGDFYTVIQDKDNVTPTVVHSRASAAECILLANNDTATPGGRATVTLGTNCFYANWAANSEVNDQICYIAMGAGGWTQTTVPGTTSASYTPAEYVSQTWTQSTVPTTLSSALTLAEEYSGIIWSQVTPPSTASTAYTPTVALLWSPTNVPGVATAVSTISFWSGKGWSQTTVPTTTSHAITPPFSLVDEDGADITNCVVEFIDWPSALEIDIVNG